MSTSLRCKDGAAWESCHLFGLAGQGGNMNPGIAPTPTRTPEVKPAPHFAVNAPSRYVRFGPFQLDLLRYELFKNGTRVKLQGKVGEVLLILIENPGEIITREALRMRLWPMDTHVNYDANVNTTVNKLRRVLNDSSEQSSLIETIPRKGYTFAGKLEYVDQPAVKDPEETLNGETQSREQVTLGAKTSFLRSLPASATWFTAGMIALVIAGILFGAAIVLYAHHSR